MSTPEDIFNLILYLVIFYVAPTLAAVALIMVVVLVLRPVLWWGTKLVRLVDELMWFAYNPFRFVIRGGRDVRDGRIARISRFFWVVLHYSLIAVLYKFLVYFLTTPIRLFTAIYVDFLLYLSRLFSDLVEELITPKYGAMRYQKGFRYAFGWIIGSPKRAILFFVKFLLGVFDAILMVLVSVAFPTFTMYHGTNEEYAAKILRERKWLVGNGNFAGSGIYFARQLRVAKSYSEKTAHDKPRVILARVSFTGLQNCVNLPYKTRKFVGVGGDGDALAEAVRLPTYALEFWRNRSNWWEYVILRPKERGQLIKSWRIRHIGMVNLNGKIAQFSRLWGGNAHYCLSLVNIAMGVVSAVICVFLAAGYELLFFQ
jgi:hypothetical protein